MLTCIIVSAGIRPRDELARDCQLEVGERGGVVVNNYLQTSDPDIYAIGEVAMHAGMIYGLVAPGYQMAEIVARNLTGSDDRFTGTDLSTKLNLMGVDVASFGDYEAGTDRAVPLIHQDPFGGVYKKLLLDHEGKRLLGGILVGDASDYGSLSALAKSGDSLPCAPGEFPADGGAAIKYGGVQIAVYNFASRGQWYACQNMCPHMNAFVLSRGMLGDAGDEPRVACPLYKKPFSLATGKCLSGEDYSLKIFPVRVQGDDVYLELPAREQLNALLATDLHCIRSEACSASAPAH